MEPYTKSGKSGKFTATKTDHVPGNAKGVSQYDKLISRNANRSLKKSLRRVIKNQLHDEIKNFNEK